MGWLFDTDAISEVLRPRPSEGYLEWLRTIPIGAQFTTSVTIAEMFWGAFRSSARDRHLDNIRRRVIPVLHVIPFHVVAAERFGQIKATLEANGALLPDADLQIASIALVENHELVTGNLGHFARIPGLRINTALAATRRHS